MSDAGESLRTRVLKGGVYLVLRQGLGTLIGFAAVMLIVRAIGPAEYGLAATAVGLATYGLELAPLGAGAYLIRREGVLPDEDRDQAFTCLLVTGALGLAVALAALPLLGAAMGVGRFQLLAAAAFGVIPLSVLANYPLALLERALEFRRIAFIEFVSQTTGHAVGLALTYNDFGGAALVAGFWAKELVGLALLVRTLDHRPRLRWETARIRRILGFGTAFGIAGWVWQAGDAVAPFVVGRLAGPEVLGVIALANRFLGSMNLVAAAARRLAFAALARVQEDRAKLSRAASEAMVIQALTIGFLVFGFHVVAHLAFPHLLGGRWTGLLVVYPYLALGTLTNASFSFHVQLLHVLERSWDVALYHGLRVVVFLAGLALLLPRFGLVGCGYAELLGAFAGYPLVHLLVARQGVRPSYGPPFAVQAILGGALFFRELGWPVALAPLAIIAWPGTWRLALEHARSLRGKARPAPPELARARR